MADAEARIMEMVRKELEKDRSVATADLFEKAKKIDASVAKLSPRQFHAKYPLQVKRALKGGRRKAAGGRKGGAGKRGAAGKGTRKRAAEKAAAPVSSGRGRRRAGGKRAAPGRRGRPAAAPAAAGAGRGDVRGLLLQFAKQVAQADDKAALVDVLAGLDGWVDRMVAAARR